jgi:hypothetical protein
MINLLGSLHEIETKSEPNICIVRLRTSIWEDNRGVHCKKDLIPMKKLSSGYQLLEEDVANGGAEDVWMRTVNTDICQDGIYTFTTCNEHKDWETGYIDDYDYRLVPYQKEEKR